ncbi:hypothetical protein ADUPG1_005620, partial [Aduncisulcus paluster]
MTLIDKDAGKDTPRTIDNPSRWRPNVVSNTSQRAFFLPVAKRIMTFALSHGLIGGYQRGFIPGVDGCLINIMETREWISADESNCAACLDLTNAYGSIDHDLIDRTLQGTCHPHAYEILKDTISMTIHCGADSARTRKGTSQGNAISPVIFNIILDIIIPDQLKPRIRAFADDLILLAKSREELIHLTGELITALKTGG